MRGSRGAGGSDGRRGKVREKGTAEVQIDSKAVHIINIHTICLQ